MDARLPLNLPEANPVSTSGAESGSSSLALQDKKEPLTPQELSDIKAVAVKFESLFLNMIFDSMSKEAEKGSFVDNGPGYKIFNSLFYESVANSATFGKGIGIARMIVNYFEEHPSLAASSGLKELNESVSNMSATDNVLQAYRASSGHASPEQEGFGNNGGQPAGVSGGVKGAAYVTPDGLAKKASQLYGVPYGLVKAMMKVESGYNPYAVSDKGAVGLMQIMPETAQEMGINPYDPESNVLGGTMYIKKLLDMYGGNVGLALAAYNAGTGNVSKYEGIPPFEETRNYVDKVLSYYREFSSAGGSKS